MWRQHPCWLHPEFFRVQFLHAPAMIWACISNFRSKRGYYSYPNKWFYLFLKTGIETILTMDILLVYYYFERWIIWTNRFYLSHSVFHTTLLISVVLSFDPQIIVWTNINHMQQVTFCTKCTQWFQTLFWVLIPLCTPKMHANILKVVLPSRTCPYTSNIHSFGSQTCCRMPTNVDPDPVPWNLCVY